MKNEHILIVGAGIIATSYIKVLIKLDKKITVISRGEEKAKVLRETYSQLEVISGGLDSSTNLSKYSHAIVASQIDYLADITILLINGGLKNILVEKPLTYSLEVIDNLIKLANSNNSDVFVAYNRRNYQSVIKAKQLIEMDGGVSSVKFDFTEAIFRIDESKFSKESQYYWGIANSSHVIDTAFYLAGYPKELKVHTSGNEVHWHSAGSIFLGHGVTNKNVPFSYHSDWGCPGRWSIEIQTPMRKLIFSPMEVLQEQKKGTFAVSEVEADYDIDKEFKPGFYHQTLSFLSIPSDSLMTVNELSKAIPFYHKIFGYVKSI